MNFTGDLNNINKKYSGILVEITGGCYICDSIDYDMLKNYTWHINNGYARTTIIDPITRKKINVYMHRMLFPSYKECDHINRIKHDNRRENIRSVTRSENLYNKNKDKNSSSQYKGRPAKLNNELC